MIWVIFMTLHVLFAISVARLEEKDSELKADHDKLHNRYTEVSTCGCSY